MNNKIETLKLLLKHGADVNLLYQPNGIKATSMNIAAMKQNISVMKLLIQYGFNCNKLINNICHVHPRRSVFLELCFNGSVDCMDYIMNKCKNKIDIWQRDINGWNGLHLAVNEENVSMVEYLLTKVYDNQDIRMKVLNQRIGIQHRHISKIAAMKSSESGLTIFKLLIKYKCPINANAVIRRAAIKSPLILDFMLNEKLFSNYSYLTNALIRCIIWDAAGFMIHENINIVVRFLCNMKDEMAKNEYKQCIIDIFSTIMMYGTMDGYFEFFKQLIGVFLHIRNHAQGDDYGYNYNNNIDWRKFTQSSLIDQSCVQQILNKITDSRNPINWIDNKWCDLLMTMRSSFDNSQILDKYSSTNHIIDQSYCCSKSHLMTEMKENQCLSFEQCNYCNGFCVFCKWACNECKEYICDDCSVAIDADRKLKQKKFKQFFKIIDGCDKRSRLVKTVKF